MHSVLFLPPQAPSTIGKRKEEGTMLFFNIFPLQSKPGKSVERPLAFGRGARGTRAAPSDESREGTPDTAPSTFGNSRCRAAGAAPASNRPKAELLPPTGTRAGPRPSALGPRPRRLATLQARGAALNS
jgi:hypothetical protein